MMTWAALKLLFTTAKGWLKMLPYIIVISLAVYVGYKAYHWVDSRGANRIQVQWDKETEDYKRAVAALKATLVVKEQDHIRETIKISDQLAKEKLDHEEDVVAITAEYAERLRKSETRAEIYQRQAQGGPASCSSLASYTTQLDNSLEEGRSLVKEFRSLIGLRDRQLTLVGEQLLADRKLFTDQETGK